MSEKFKNPWLVLQHGWGKSPEQKAKEKAYNHEYYLKNKNKWKSLYNDTEKQFGSKVDEMNRSISGAEARVSATKNEYDKAANAYNKALSDYKDFLNTIPKVGSQRTREQNRMLDDRQKRLREIKSELDKTENTYRNAQKDLKSQMTERDRNQAQVNRIKNRAENAEREYNAYENSEAGESERYKREMKGLKTRLSKQQERFEKNYGDFDRKNREIGNKIQENAWVGDTHYSKVKPKNASEAQALAAKGRRDKALLKQIKEHQRGANDENVNKQRGWMKEVSDISDTQREMRSLASKRRASAMARSAQAQQQATQENRKKFQNEQRNVEIQSNKDISTQRTRANNIQKQMQATQSKVSQLMETLEDGMSKGYDKNNNYMKKIAQQIRDEQNNLAKQRQQLNTVNTAIKTLEKKAKKAHSNI